MKISFLICFAVALLELAAPAPDALVWRYLENKKHSNLTKVLQKDVENSAKKAGISKVRLLLCGQLTKTPFTYYCIFKGEKTEEGVLFCVAFTWTDDGMKELRRDTNLKLMKEMKLWNPVADLKSDNTSHWKGKADKRYRKNASKFEELALAEVETKLKLAFTLVYVDHYFLREEFGKVNRSYGVIYRVELVGDYATKPLLTAFVRVQFTDNGDGKGLLTATNMTESRFSPELMLLIEMEEEGKGDGGVKETTSLAKPKEQQLLTTIPTPQDPLEPEFRGALAEFIKIANRKPKYTHYKSLQLRKDTSPKYFLLLKCECSGYKNLLYAYVSFSAEENQNKEAEIQFHESEAFFETEEEMTTSNDEISQAVNVEFKKFKKVGEFEKRIVSNITAKKYEAELSTKTLPIPLKELTVEQLETTSQEMGVIESFKYRLQWNQKKAGLTPTRKTLYACAYKQLGRVMNIYKLSEDPRIACLE